MQKTSRSGTPLATGSVTLASVLVVLVLLAGCGGGRSDHGSTASAKSSVAARDKNLRAVVAGVEGCKRKVQAATQLPQSAKAELDEVCKLGFKTGVTEIGRVVRQVCDEIALQTPTHQVTRANAIDACEARDNR